MALSQVNSNIYVWGNRRYACDPNKNEMILQPFGLKCFAGKIFREIACSYHYCIAVTDKNDVYFWGELVKDYNAQKPSDQIITLKQIQKPNAQVDSNDSSPDSDKSSQSSATESESNDSSDCE